MALRRKSDNEFNFFTQKGILYKYLIKGSNQSHKTG